MFCKNKMSSEQRRTWKLKMYNRWEDTLEERLAGVRAARAKLEEQIERDTVTTTSTGTTPLDE
jgi:hypothetical protein